MGFQGREKNEDPDDFVLLAVDILPVILYVGEWCGWEKFAGSLGKFLSIPG